MCDPIKDDNYFIFKSIIKPSKKFISLREQNIKELEKIKNNQTLFVPHEETINDVLLQYIGYFRNN